MNGRGGKTSKRNFYQYPTPSGNRPAKRSEFERSRKISPVIQHADERQVFRGGLLGSEAPHVECVAQKVDLAIAEIYPRDLRIPATARRRLPFQTQRVRWRIEVLSLNRKFSVDKLE